MILLDTNALIWLDDGSDRLGAQSLAIIRAEWQQDSVFVSAISFWECAMLERDRRVAFPQSVAAWRTSMLDKGTREIALDGAVAAAAVTLALPHKDPADRFIIATALAKDAVLVTADERILGWRGQLRCQDARL
ncbi:MAG: type II toxin-antitoxin system VapC family toxin [Alphaproteobacteria bacterium]|nr:type II toxin-antitoxin system VapC family toxin [Alphaproteobacteria bacterium]